MPATASLRAAEKPGMENTPTTRCTCSLQVGSMNEACEACQHEYLQWLVSNWAEAREEARYLAPELLPHWSAA